MEDKDLQQHGKEDTKPLYVKLRGEHGKFNDEDGAFNLAKVKNSYREDVSVKFLNISGEAILIKFKNIYGKAVLGKFKNSYEEYVFGKFKNIYEESIIAKFLNSDKNSALNSNFMLITTFSLGLLFGFLFTQQKYVFSDSRNISEKSTKTEQCSCRPAKTQSPDKNTSEQCSCNP